MEVRPIIKLTLSQTDKIAEGVCKVVLFLLWALTMYTFLKSPKIIPIHFSGSGKVDNYGSKYFIFILPSIATAIYFGLSALNKYPHIFNYMSKITEDNAVQQYTSATKMLRYLKLVILIIFTIIVLFTFLNIVGLKEGVGSWFLPFVFALILLPTIIFICKLFKKK